jgi:fucose 4-O-acetylase-like acetyltransferase
MGKKNLSIETLRGIAIVLIVIEHVIGMDAAGGMRIEYPHLLRYIYLHSSYISMPLFTAIAGWVYALKDNAQPPFKEFASSKAMRLLLPMIAVGTIYYLTQNIVPGTNNSNELSQIWRIYIFPHTLYWYLPSLFIMLLMQWTIDHYRKMNTFKQWMGWCILALLISAVHNKGFMCYIPDFFSFKGALKMLPYFFAGVAVQRFAANIYHSRVLHIIYALLVCIGIASIQWVWFAPADVGSHIRLLQPLTIIPTLFLLLSLKWHSHFWVWIGSYSYSIYLFHGFATSGVRILMRKAGISDITPIFITAVILSVLLPMLVDKIVSHSRWGRIILLGKKKRMHKLPHQVEQNVENGFGQKR